MALYDAFISYSHAKDKPIAAALQSAVQTLGKPWYRRRALRVFRDDTSLSATPHLWPSIELALGQSRFFVLLASPEAAASKWVNKEVSYWLDHNSIETLLVGVTDGDLAWDDAVGDFAWCECMPLPPILKGKFANEPKWVDLRAYRDGADPRDAKFIELGADFAAAIHGTPKDDLLSQEVRQQRRALTLAWSAAGLLLIFAGLAGWQLKATIDAELAATNQKALAQAQRDRAERNFGVARQAAKDVVIELAEKLRHEQGMRVASRRRILDTARRLIDDLAKAEPDDPKLRENRGLMLLSFTTTYLEGGDLRRARSTVEEGLAIFRKLTADYPDNPAWPRGASWALELLGDVRSVDGDPPGALAARDESLAIIRKVAAANQRLLGLQVSLYSSLDSMGDMRLAAGDHSGALALYDESYTIKRKLDTDKPGVEIYQREIYWSIVKIGDVRLAAGDLAKALAAYDEGLARARRLALSDPGNTNIQNDISTFLVRIGNVRFSMDGRVAGLAAFEESLQVMRTFATTDRDNVEWQVSLAVVLNAVGKLADPARAREVLTEALAILDALARDGKLATDKKDWPQRIRDSLARLSLRDTKTQ